MAIVNIETLKKLEDYTDLVYKKQAELSDLKKDFEQIQIQYKAIEDDYYLKSINDIKNHINNGLFRSEILKNSSEEIEYKKTLYSTVYESVLEYLNSSNFIDYLLNFSKKLDSTFSLELSKNKQSLSNVISSFQINLLDEVDVIKFVSRDFEHDFSVNILAPKLTKNIINNNLS